MTTQPLQKPIHIRLPALGLVLKPLAAQRVKNIRLMGLLVTPHRAAGSSLTLLPLLIAMVFKLPVTVLAVARVIWPWMP